MKVLHKIYKSFFIRYTNKLINNFYKSLNFSAIFICLLAASVAYSASIINSKHDLSYLATITQGNMNRYFTQYNEVCVYCHTPHNANTASTAPLWNRNIPAGPYNVYSSSTMDTTPSNPPSGISLACLSCHDGTLAVDSIINPPNSGWSSSPFHAKMSQGGALPDSCSASQCHGVGGLGGDHTASYLIETDGTGLSNDHPISMMYPTDQPTQFNSISNGKVGSLPLYSGKVECSSCHNVHNPATVPFLRSTNSVSALCTTCHIK